MALSFLRDLVHPDLPYPARIVRYFLHTLIHDSLELRKVRNQTLVLKTTEIQLEVFSLTPVFFSDCYPQHIVHAQTAKTCPQEDSYRSIEFLRRREG
jgi:hypothetical protein